MALKNAWQNKHSNAMQQLALEFDNAQAAAGDDRQAHPAPSLDSGTISDQQLEDIPALSAVPDYHIVRSRRRTLGITVHRGVVEVRAPLRAPKYWIHEFILEKQQWINAQVATQKKQLLEIYQIIDGASLPILGEPIRIRISNRSLKSNQIIKRARCELRDSTLHLQIPPQPTSIQYAKTDYDEATATKLLMPWIKSQADNYMSASSRQLAETMGLGEKLNAVKYRRTSSKWGHCTSDGVIQYNPLIILAPLFVIDYIIAHEVCHLKHANHSKTYWKLVDKVCQQRASAEAWLKQHGHKLAIEISKAA